MARDRIAQLEETVASLSRDLNLERAARGLEHDALENASLRAEVQIEQMRRTVAAMADQLSYEIRRGGL